MSLLLKSILPFCCLQLIALSSAQTTTVAPTNASQSSDNYFDPNWSICFEFTWMGPQFDNNTQYNGTCADHMDETRAKNVPCSDPLVITTNGNEPDMAWLWREKQRSVICRRSSTQVCGRYVYRYNGQVENATYMCTKVTSVAERKALQTGCYKQQMDGYEVELCLCTAGTGLYYPCNAAFSLKAPVLSLVFVLGFLLSS